MIRSALHAIAALVWPLVSLWFALTQRPPRTTLSALRASYRAYHRARQPVCICARHHQAADGWKLLWLLAPPFGYLLHPRLRPWVIADRHSRFAGPLTWLWHRIGKVIAVRQGAGPLAHAETTRLVLAKLARGESFLIFPAGDDSIEEPYSVLLGQVLSAAPHTPVLCVRWERDALSYRELQVESAATGWRGVRERALCVRSALLELDAAAS